VLSSAAIFAYSAYYPAHISDKIPYFQELKSIPMKKYAFSIFFFLGIGFLFTSCGSADAAEKTSNSFFALLIKGQYAKAEKMVDRPPGDTTDFIAQMQALGENQVNGKLKSAKKSIGFSTSINNGVTTVELPYILVYEKGERRVQVVIVDHGSGYKIASVQ
jgi:hypothetical protein